MKNLQILSLLAGVALISCSSKSSTPAPASPPSGGTTVIATVPTKDYTFDNVASWADEFDGAAVDTSKWAFETGGSGWGNNELEYYTSGNNAQLSNGNLIITAKKEFQGTRNYTSARMYSKGAGNFLYGRIEVKAKIPGGKGTWPAIWMLSTDNAYGNWPNSGEIDIMEHVGFEPDNIYITMHTGAYNHVLNTQKGVKINIPNATSDYHIYRIDWTPAAITAFIDNQQVFVFKNEGTGSSVWPYDKRFHMMLNVAVGGDWGGAQGVDDNIFPAAMQVDYIRYYKVSNL